MDERDYDYWDFQDIKSEIGRLESEGIQCEGDFESLVETQHKGATQHDRLQRQRMATRVGKNVRQHDSFN